jgi:aspartyl-tRNA(Asn)/glutamyl-tRNA(Gln) amidotransferase subunit C
MQVTNELIQHLAKLSRLAPSEAQIEALKTDLEKMLDMVAVLQQLDTTGVTPLRHINQNAIAKYRADEVGNQLTNAAAMQLPQEAKAPYFIVPKVISN